MMNKTYISIFSCLILSFVLSSYWISKQTNNSFDIYSNLDNLVSQVLVDLGDKKELHFRSNLDEIKIKQGYEIITKGKTIGPDGKVTRIQSKHFVCTDCHNIKREDPDLTKADPEARLKYVVEQNMKFLPGSPLYGIVDRKTWYNDDYFAKYGDLVSPAKDTLKNAIHLCAVQCSQGRALESWEMESVIVYLNSIGLKMSDLNFSENELNSLKTSSNEEIINTIKSKYLAKSPATFLSPIPKNERKYGQNGNSKNGQLIYEYSCLTCHNDTGVTNYILNKESLTFNHLNRYSNTDTHFSVYYITRKGTYAMNGYKPYMPNYTLEKLSHQQLEDLMAYIKEMAR